MIIASTILRICTLLLIFFGIINLLRMAFFLIGSDIYTLKQHIRNRRKKQKYFTYFPIISIVIPAFNEENTIVKNVQSIFESDYPQNKLEAIIVDDGSTDDTVKKIKDFHANHPQYSIKIVRQNRLGKAHALNNGMKNFALGDLIMCLDADSFLSKDAIINTVQYFGDKKVMAVASNVKIVKSKGLLNLIQQYEYILCYQMKRAQTLFNIEYIIGGIGSTFRRGVLEAIDFYDGNTVTEDIDITMKILRVGNNMVRVVYGADVITYTQGAVTLSDLIKQRSRWKWGRYQTFFKNKSFFFSNKKEFTKGLTWVYLPYALFGDIAFFLEPLFVVYILFLIIKYHDFFTLFSAFLVISFYIIMNILAEDTISLKDKITYIFFAPTMYVLFYILSFVEYVALLKSLINMQKLEKSIRNHTNFWKPVVRLPTR